MTTGTVLTYKHPPLLILCVLGSLVAHAVMLTLLPGWIARHNATPAPLTVELQNPEPPPEIEPPKPLPMQTAPARAEPVKPAVKQARDTPPPTQAPILTAPPEAPPSPAAAIVPEQRPAPPPEAPRPPLVAATAPVMPPRSDAAYLNNPRPAYPLAARRRGDQGTVLIRVLVTADGNAASVGLEKTSGHPTLDEAALTAVKSWRFIPARQGAQAVESPYVVPVVFKLD